jgi:uncharacterized protein
LDDRRPLGENRRGDVVAIEVKAAPRVVRRDTKHLEWLRDRLGERFIRGVVMTPGSVGSELGDRIVQMPIAALWTPEAWHGVPSAAGP